MALPKVSAPKYYLTLKATGEEVEYRPYSVKEEKNLLLAIESNDEKMILMAVRDLIEACTFGKVKAMDMAMFDFEYLFLMLRAKSVGETADLNLPCTSCEARTKVSVNVEEVELSGEVREEIKVELTPEIGLIMRYPKVESVNSQVKKGKSSEYETTVALLASCIDTIYDEENVYPASDHTPKELNEFVESLSTAQFKKLIEEFGTLPTLSKDVDFNCSSCGAPNSIHLEGLKSFF